jgi:hypothetical protein
MQNIKTGGFKMKRITLMIAVITVFSVALFAVKKANNEKEKEAIKKVIQEAYVDGIKNLGNIEKIEKGFHPDFNMLSVQDNKLRKFPISRWIEGVEKAKKENPDGPKVKASVNFLIVDVIGNVGIAKFETYSGSKLAFTDIMILLKFEEGWRIVSKVYHRHQ